MDASFWALVGLIIFLGILAYFKVPALIAKGLDGRADKIRDELEEARRLREEAAAVLAEYQKKRKEAEAEAQSIVDAAKAEADTIAAEAKTKTEEFVVRRTAMAEQKIAQAEADAVNAVRSTAVDVAVEAAEKLLTQKVTPAKAGDLFKQSLSQVKSGLN